MSKTTELALGYTVIWKDATSYSRSSPEGTTEPRIWQTRLERYFRVSVHRCMHDDENWYLSTVPVLFDGVLLGNRNIDDALLEALCVLHRRLSGLLEKFPEDMPKIPNAGEEE